MPVTPYITNAALMTSVAARMGTYASNLTASGPQWADIVSTANTEAYQTIRRVLVSRGYPVAVIDTWDDRTEFNRKIGICYALREGAVVHGFDNLEVLSKFCECVEELETVVVLVDGEEPSSTGARVGYGDKDRDDDVFVLADMEL